MPLRYKWTKRPRADGCFHGELGVAAPELAKERVRRVAPERPRIVLRALDSNFRTRWLQCHRRRKWGNPDCRLHTPNEKECGMRAWGCFPDGNSRRGCAVRSFLKPLVGGVRVVQHLDAGFALPLEPVLARMCVDPGCRIGQTRNRQADANARQRSEGSLDLCRPADGGVSQH